MDQENGWAIAPSYSPKIQNQKANQQLQIATHWSSNLETNNYGQSAPHLTDLPALGLPVSILGYGFCEILPSDDS
jgi:hypothetical protein